MSTQFSSWEFNPTHPPAARWGASPPPIEEEPSATGPLEPSWSREELAVVVGLVLLSLILRFHDYTLAPLFADNFHEVQFVWLGMNLFLHGDPITWSNFPVYSSFQPYPFLGATPGLVHHWMDQPPLFGYIMGGWALLLGDRDLSQATAAQARFLPIVFSSASVPLVYLLGRSLLGRFPSMVGAALLATAPAAVLLGREGEPESLQAILLLAALICCAQILRRNSSRWIVGLLLGCCLLAPLLKVPGVAIAGICAVILLFDRRWQLAALTGGAGILGLLLYALYGLIVDWHLFVAVVGQQAAFRINVISALDFIADPTGINRPLHDGWWLFGLFGVGALLLATQRGKELFLAWPVVAYAVTMMLLAGQRQTAQYGWYKIIIYPEVYLAAGYLIWEFVSRYSSVGWLLLLTLGGATATNWWLGGADHLWIPNPLLLVVIIAIVVLPPLWVKLSPDDLRAKAAAKWVAIASLAFLALGNLVESWNLAHTFFYM
ncbi:MAG: glycosyltransferase family 39 protein [Candidatus Dormibacteraceae bacterium]